MFGFIKLTDAFTTGTLDHAAEEEPRRRRADPRQGRPHAGHRSPTSTVVMKGLPLTYSKDMQEDKVPTFEAFDALELSPAGHGRHGRRPGAGTPRSMAAAAGAGFSTATDLADWLVRELNMPFRDAHHVTGRGGEEGRDEGRRSAGPAAGRLAGDRAAHHLGHLRPC